jgi:hypothetical protein
MAVIELNVPRPGFGSSVLAWWLILTIEPYGYPVDYDYFFLGYFR